MLGLLRHQITFRKAPRNDMTCRHCERAQRARQSKVLRLLRPFGARNDSIS